MGKMKQAQDKLYQVIKHKRDCNVNSAIIYDDYDRLYRHMIMYNLEKAVKLCKALLLKQQEDMPLSHIKLFNFNLANAYLLAGNYTDAKNRYQKCLEADPQGKLRSYALNNLGLACWWHKNPIQNKRQQIKKQDAQKVEKDFNQCRQLFAKSILISEQTNKQMEQDTKMLLQQTLNMKTGHLNQQAQFNSQYSIKPLYNLAQFYMYNQPLSKLQILYWLKKSLDLSKMIKKQTQFNRIFSQYCLLTNNIQTIKQKLPSIVDKYRYSQMFIQEGETAYIIGKILMNSSSRNGNNSKQESKQGTKQNINQDKKKGQQYMNRVKQLKSALPTWSWKMKYLAYDELDLVNKN